MQRKLSGNGPRGANERYVNRKGPPCFENTSGDAFRLTQTPSVPLTPRVVLFFVFVHTPRDGMLLLMLSVRLFSHTTRDDMPL